MNISRRSMICLTASCMCLAGLTQTPDGRDETGKPELTPRISTIPVRVVLANIRVEGERRDSAILRDEAFVRFQYVIENKEYNNQRARKNEIVWWNQAREDLLRRGETNKARLYPEKPLPTFPPCALKIDRAVTDWMLAPSIKIFRVMDRKDGKIVRSEGWSADELKCKPTLKLSDISASRSLLEETPLIVYGEFDKTLIDKLENGVYELEVSLDTKAAENLNVAETGIVSNKFVFYIKDAENDDEKWWLEKRSFRDAEGKGDWETLIRLADDALKRYHDKPIIYMCWYWKGNALRNMGKDEEALAAYEEAWKHRWKHMEPHREWAVTEPMYDLRRKLNKLPPKKQ